MLQNHAQQLAQQLDHYKLRGSLYNLHSESFESVYTYQLSSYLYLLQVQSIKVIKTQKTNLLLLTFLQSYKELKSKIIKFELIQISNSNIADKLGSMSQKPKYDNNFLTSQNGCVVIEQSSQRQRGPASSIISSDQKSVWVTGDKLPQQCIISLKKIIKKPIFYNLIGIYCWHQYDSNPALIQIFGKCVPQLDKWNLITKIRLNLIDTWQYFKIDDLNADKFKQIKIKIVENYGDSKTYINKISLHSVNPAIIKQTTYGNGASSGKINYSQQVQQDEELPQRTINLNPNLNPNPNPKSPFSKDQRRQKVHSQYHKSEQNNPPNNHINKSNLQIQQELKRANDHIIKLTRQQEQMKKVMQQQERNIIKLEQNLKNIFRSLQRINQMQQIQQKVASGYKNSQNSKYKEHIQNQQDQNHTNPKLRTKQKYPSEKYKQTRKQPSSENQQEQYQNLERQKIKQKLPTSKQKQRYEKNYPPKSDEIEQLSNMLNNYYIRTNKEKLSLSKQPDRQRERQRQRQWEKYKQKDVKKVKIGEKQQKKKQSHAKQQSQSYKHHTDIIRTNSEDDLSQYDDYQNYKTSQTSKNRAELTPSPLLQFQFQKEKAKGQKAKMLQRLVKLIQLKQKKKLELKRSGTKSRHNKQSLYQYQQEVQYDDNAQDEQN